MVGSFAKCCGSRVRILLRLFLVDFGWRGNQLFLGHDGEEWATSDGLFGESVRTGEHSYTSQSPHVEERRAGWASVSRRGPEAGRKGRRTATYSSLGNITVKRKHDFVLFFILLHARGSSRLIVD
jgi:hypothetical protein